MQNQDYLIDRSNLRQLSLYSLFPPLGLVSGAVLMTIGTVALTTGIALSIFSVIPSLVDGGEFMRRSVRLLSQGLTTIFQGVLLIVPFMGPLIVLSTTYARNE